ncbi:hypothetical protein SAMN05421833_12953 [Microbispora rosea]|uniref:Uncharacterized protein n=1 Tax=Microbispora rosea TaxID=58117 RepID=A0A1N7GIE7_9ACTN|nr:hypothetical protein [Microbispora rosea]GIH51641.1 hypothetical protein Mro03_68200 [Microbispora rosea subsp. rosea]SIS12312.1 hypothetical protein SAMN05421833_12953 [Microbispora rosea]
MTATSTDTLDEYGIPQGEWMGLVRRARIGRERKLAMLTVGSYANADGTGIYCGVARLAVDCEVSYRTAGRYFAWARNVGLVALVRHGNRRRGKADEYRLTASPELLHHLDIPDPDVYRKLVGDVAAANRADSNKRQRQLAGRDRADATAADTKDDRRTGDDDAGDLRTRGDRRNDACEAVPTDTQASVRTGFYGHAADGSTDIPGVRPPSMDHLTSLTDLPWVPTPARNARYHYARARASERRTGFIDQTTPSDRADVHGMRHRAGPGRLVLHLPNPGGPTRSAAIGGGVKVGAAARPPAEPAAVRTRYRRSSRSPPDHLRRSYATPCPPPRARVRGRVAIEGRNWFAWDQSPSRFLCGRSSCRGSTGRPPDRSPSVRGRKEQLMAAKRRRRKVPNLGEWGPLALRAALIALDWLLNGSGPR